MTAVQAPQNKLYKNKIKHCAQIILDPKQNANAQDKTSSAFFNMSNVSILHRQSPVAT